MWRMINTVRARNVILPFVTQGQPGKPDGVVVLVL